MKDEKGNDANLVQKDGEALASTSREEVMNDNCSEIDQKVGSFDNRNCGKLKFHFV